jgi:glutathione S-transferase
MLCTFTNVKVPRMKGLGLPDEARVAQAESDLDTVLAYYNKVLARQKYIAGDELTLADLFHLPNGAALKAGRWKEVFAKYPHTDKWFKELQESGTWQKAAAEAQTFP